MPGIGPLKFSKPSKLASQTASWCCCSRSNSYIATAASMPFSKRSATTCFCRFERMLRVLRMPLGRARSLNIAGLVWQRGGGALDQSRCCSETRDQAQKNNSTLNAIVPRFQYMSQRNVLWHANTQPEVDEATATTATAAAQRNSIAKVTQGRGLSPSRLVSKHFLRMYLSISK